MKNDKYRTIMSSRTSDFRGSYLRYHRPAQKTNGVLQKAQASVTIVISCRYLEAAVVVYWVMSQS